MGFAMVSVTPHHPNMMETNSLLVIEPDPLLRELFYLCITEFMAWDVVTTDSIAAGLHFCLIHPFDIILLTISDDEAEQKTCFDFLKTLDQNSIAESTPLLLLTQQPVFALPEHLRSHRTIHTLSKPFDPLTLPQQLLTLLHSDKS
jgi:CheY-like chemotaxis protein